MIEKDYWKKVFYVIRNWDFYKKGKNVIINEVNGDICEKVSIWKPIMLET